MDNSIAIIIWTGLIIGSIAWYAFLLFYVGYKGGVEIKEMTKTLSDRNDDAARAGKTSDL